MDTPSTSVSGAMGRSTKKKKVTKWDASDDTFDDRDSTRTPPTLVKVKSWISTLDQSNDKKEEEERAGGSPLYGFDNLNYPYSLNPHYDLISNGSYQNGEEKLIEDELKQYCISNTVSENSNDKSPIVHSRPATRQRKFPENVLTSPDNENQKEFCEYLQLMKPTDKKNVIILQNRRSKRVTNLSKKEQDKKLISEQENNSIGKSKDKLLDYKATYKFPKPPDNLDIIDFDGIEEEIWFKKWAKQAKKNSNKAAKKRKSDVSVNDILSDECSATKIKTPRRRKSNKELLDSNENESTSNRTRSKSRGPAARNRSTANSAAKRGRSESRGSAMTKRNSTDTSETTDSDEHRSTMTKKLERSKSRNSNKRANRSESSITLKMFNGAQNKNGFKGKVERTIRDDKSEATDIKTRSMKLIMKKKLRTKLAQTVNKVDNKALKTNKHTKARKGSAETGFKVKRPVFKIKLSSDKRGRPPKKIFKSLVKNNPKTAAKSEPSSPEKPQNNLTINEMDFDMNLPKESENPAVIYLSDSCSEPDTLPIFVSEFNNVESRPGISQIITKKIESKSSTIKTICYYDRDRPSTVNRLNEAFKRHDSAIQTEPQDKLELHSEILCIQKTCAIQTEPEGKRQFHSQILNIQKTSDEDSEEDPSEKSGSTPEPPVYIGKRPIAGIKWTNAKKQLENENSINLNTRHGPILKIFYVDFDLVLCQELSVSFWNQSAPGNVLGAHNMWTIKGSIQRQTMTNNYTLKESLEMVACNYYSLAYIELWTKEHESYQQDVPVTNVYAVVYFWTKQYNGLVKKVLQLENINGFADDVQYSIVKSSPKIVVSWHFTGNEMNNRKKTYVYCYQVASDFQSICNVDKFEAVDHYVSSLHNIEGCDTLIMGCGENKITLWNIEGGRLAATIEMAEIKSPLATLWVKCDRGFLFTLQQCVDRELRLIAIHSMNHSWRRLARYKPPQAYDRLKGVCVENGIILGFYDQGIVCWNAGSQEIVVETAARKETDYISGNYLISVDNNQVNVRHAFTSLLEVGYWH